MTALTGMPGWPALLIALAATAVVMAAFTAAAILLLDRDPYVARCALAELAAAIRRPPAPAPFPVVTAAGRPPAAVAPDDTCDQIFPPWMPFGALWLTPEGHLL